MISVKKEAFIKNLKYLLSNLLIIENLTISKRVNLLKSFCKNLKNCTILLGNFKERETAKRAVKVSISRASMVSRGRLELPTSGL